jgi:hypothetical protein
MVRSRQEERSAINEVTLTLRLTRVDRDVLEILIRHQATLATAQGFAMNPTVASYLRSLIRREAQRLEIAGHREGVRSESSGDEKT